MSNSPIIANQRRNVTEEEKIEFNELARICMEQIRINPEEHHSVEKLPNPRTSEDILYVLLLATVVF
jgi:hypothetical protein